VRSCGDYALCEYHGDDQFGHLKMFRTEDAQQWLVEIIAAAEPLVRLFWSIKAG
jgi:hypothetical protein